ncbi:MAG TPA: hypothetical protein VFD03_12715 [Clostridia bacterium]|nr:hypothetical protein [Clostridia bacterium]
MKFGNIRIAYSWVYAVLSENNTDTVADIVKYVFIKRLKSEIITEWMEYDRESKYN